jgi:hypothetical protein
MARIASEIAARHPDLDGEFRRVAQEWYASNRAKFGSRYADGRPEAGKDWYSHHPAEYNWTVLTSPDERDPSKIEPGTPNLYICYRVVNDASTMKMYPASGSESVVEWNLRSNAMRQELLTKLQAAAHPHRMTALALWISTELRIMALRGEIEERRKDLEKSLSDIDRELEAFFPKTAEPEDAIMEEVESGSDQEKIVPGVASTKKPSVSGALRTEAGARVIRRINLGGIRIRKKSAAENHRQKRERWKDVETQQRKAPTPRHEQAAKAQAPKRFRVIDAPAMIEENIVSERDAAEIANNATEAGPSGLSNRQRRALKKRIKRELPKATEPVVNTPAFAPEKRPKKRRGAIPTLAAVERLSVESLGKEGMERVVQAMSALLSRALDDPKNVARFDVASVRTEISEKRIIPDQLGQTLFLIVRPLLGDGSEADRAFRMGEILRELAKAVLETIKAESSDLPKWIVERAGQSYRAPEPAEIQPDRVQARAATVKPSSGLRAIRLGLLKEAAPRRRTFGAAHAHP